MQVELKDKDQFKPFTISIETEAEANLVSALFGGLTTTITRAYGVVDYSTDEVYNFIAHKFGINGDNRPRLDIKLTK